MEVQTPKVDISDPAVMVQADPGFWARYGRLQLQAGVFSFERREYQREPMQSSARRLCYMKATQLGVTEFETVIKSLHGLIYKRYKKGVLVLFPTTDNVQEFSKSRFNPFIAANRATVGRFVKIGGEGTDTASLKKIHNAFLYLRGARLTQSVGLVGDEKESVQLREAPVDCVKFEEFDLMSDDAVMKAKMRMGDSDIAEEVYISNPTLPDYGIDTIFQESDQRHWHKRCGCGTWTCPELTFPECVHERPDGPGYVACSKCGADIGPWSGVKGEWVAARPEASSFMHGYRMSQLMSGAKVNDPVDILSDYNDPPQRNLSDVYRLRLGLPHVTAEDRLTASVVFENCSLELMPTFHTGPCAMGVDVGKTKHVVVGVRTGVDRYELVKLARVTKWEELHDLARRFNVRSAVVDIRPYEDEARQFQKAERYRIFLCEYSENTVLGTSYNDLTGIVKVNRTEVFDTSHRVVTSGLVELPRRCNEVEEFARQCCNAAKVLEVNRRTGTSIYRYRTVGSGGDHYRNALNYFLLAASGSRLASVSSSQSHQTKAIEEYSVM